MLDNVTDMLSIIDKDKTNVTKLKRKRERLKMKKEIMGYVIENGVVTSPSGKSQKISYYDKAAGKAKQFADKAGIANPVVCGRMVLPQAVAD